VAALYFSAQMMRLSELISEIWKKIVKTRSRSSTWQSSKLSKLSPTDVCRHLCGRLSSVHCTPVQSILTHWTEPPSGVGVSQTRGRPTSDRRRFLSGQLELWPSEILNKI